jgi:adenylate kinase family enzyme
MKRILVIGSGGAGKSTFAARLAERTGLPLVHLDALYWRPGWVEPCKDEWASRIDELIAAERWIIDGNYGGTLERRLAACDTVIFLDISRWICLWRVIQRRIQHRGRARPDMSAGCQEQLPWDYLWWIFSYRSKRRPTILRRLSELGPEQRSTILQTRRAVNDFLGSVSSVA